MSVYLQHCTSNNAQAATQASTMQTTFALTEEQSEQINAAPHTHNFAEQAIAEWETSNVDVTEKYTTLFETQTNICATATADNIGGVIVYYNADSTLAAFYDYENFVGTVF